MDKTKRCLDDFLTSAKPFLSSTETDEVQGFVDVGEYGLALETLVDIFCEERKSISGQVISLVAATATSMGLDVDGLTRGLRPLQING